MAAISQTIVSDAFSWTKDMCVLMKFPLEFAPKGSIDDNVVLV